MKNRKQIPRVGQSADEGVEARPAAGPRDRSGSRTASSKRTLGTRQRRSTSEHSGDTATASAMANTETAVESLIAQAYESARPDVGPCPAMPDSQVRATYLPWRPSARPAAPGHAALADDDLSALGVSAGLHPRRPQLVVGARLGRRRRPRRGPGPARRHRPGGHPRGADPFDRACRTRPLAEPARARVVVAGHPGDVPAFDPLLTPTSAWGHSRNGAPPARCGAQLPSPRTPSARWARAQRGDRGTRVERARREFPPRPLLRPRRRCPAARCRPRQQHVAPPRRGSQRHPPVTSGSTGPGRRRAPVGRLRRVRRLEGRLRGRGRCCGRRRARTSARRDGYRPAAPPASSRRLRHRLVPANRS